MTQNYFSVQAARNATLFLGLSLVLSLQSAPAQPEQTIETLKQALSKNISEQTIAIFKKHCPEFNHYYKNFGLTTIGTVSLLFLSILIFTDFSDFVPKYPGAMGAFDRETPEDVHQALLRLALHNIQDPQARIERINQHMDPIRLRNLQIRQAAANRPRFPDHIEAILLKPHNQVTDKELEIINEYSYKWPLKRKLASAALAICGVAFFLHGVNKFGGASLTQEELLALETEPAKIESQRLVIWFNGLTKELKNKNLLPLLPLISQEISSAHADAQQSLETDACKENITRFALAIINYINNLHEKALHAQ